MSGSDRVVTEDPTVVQTTLAEPEEAITSLTGLSRAALGSVSFETDAGRVVELETDEPLIDDKGIVIGVIDELRYATDDGCSWDFTVYIEYFGDDTVEDGHVGGVPLGEIAHQFERRVIDSGY